MLAHEPRQSSGGSACVSWLEASGKVVRGPRRSGMPPRCAFDSRLRVHAANTARSTDAYSHSSCTAAVHSGCTRDVGEGSVCSTVPHIAYIGQVSRCRRILISEYHLLRSLVRNVCRPREYSTTSTLHSGVIWFGSATLLARCVSDS
jgi:hypothetical protein